MANKSKDFKSLVAQITKMAEPPPRRSGGGGRTIPTSGPPQRSGDGGGSGGANVPTTTPRWTGSVPDPDIKKMQKSMQEFAQLVTTYSAQARQPNQDPNKTKQEVSSRKKPFNDFIVEQYVANSDLKGEEFTPDEKKVSQEQKQPTDLIEMNIVINGLQRIGSPQSELLADNVWDFRTNNALRNVYAFAYGLVNLAKDFGNTNSQAFTSQDLSQMKDQIPDNPSSVSATDKIAKAKVLTPMIKKLSAFYKIYLNTIANHPAFRRNIAGDETFVTLQSGGGDPTALDSNEKNTMQNADQSFIGSNAIPNITNTYPLVVPSPQGAGGAINVGSLQLDAFRDVNTLRAFMSGLGWPQNQTSDPKIMLSFLDPIKKHIDQILSLPEAQEKTTTPTPSVQQTQSGGSGHDFTGDLRGGPRQGLRGINPQHRRNPNEDI